MILPKDLKKKWVAALRSGEYKQGKGYLKDENGNYCCLGVLQMITEGKCETSDIPGSPSASVPSRGFYERNGIIVDVVNSATLDALVSMNDDCNCWPNDQQSFQEIAQYIEDNVRVG